MVCASFAVIVSTGLFSGCETGSAATVFFPASAMIKARIADTANASNAHAINP